MRAWQGLFVVTSLPLVPCLLALSALNQAVRRCAGTKPFESDEEKADWVTKFARQQLDWMKTWAWTSVLTYACYWGIAYVVMNVVVSRFTVLLLSWLIDPFASDMSLATVTLMILVVGLVMFLLPPVPDMPIILQRQLLYRGEKRRDPDATLHCPLARCPACRSTSPAASCSRRRGSWPA
jgi:hypothetical protein